AALAVFKVGIDGWKALELGVEAKLETLRRAIVEGLESGPAEPFDVEAFLAKKARESKRASISLRTKRST
ncbi:MAG TPA: type II toxin-antitoxin system ParD family antitoxin, partial [Vicinamibacteria bacterium]|nr:type II toxin-antitoxin system ParD family antitoxin [Vicinamibacteria bacterium]